MGKEDAVHGFIIHTDAVVSGKVIDRSGRGASTGSPHDFRPGFVQFGGRMPHNAACTDSAKMAISVPAAAVAAAPKTPIGVPGALFQISSQHPDHLLSIKAGAVGPSARLEPRAKVRLPAT